jgi:hypothetical protein
MVHVTSIQRVILMMYRSDGGYEDWDEARDLCATLWPNEPTDGLWAQRDEKTD